MDPAPLPMAPDPFSARSTLSTPFGETVTYYRLEALEEQGLANLDTLPFTVRILLENALRHAGGEFVDAEIVKTLARWEPRPSGEGPGMELPFLPGRVVLQDFTGVPAVVDLAAMRDAVARLGGDVTRINPLVPADLVIDHSVQVDRFGTTMAFAQNVDLEYERNRERYELLRWAQQSFQNFRVVPPGTGIVHQVNLEYLAPVVMTKLVGAETIALPDTLVGTDSHTTMINGLGVLGWGVGGIEAEAVLLGQPLYLLTPEVVGVRLVGALPEGATATDLVLAVTEMLRTLGVVGRFVEFCGAGLSNLVPGGPRDDRQHGARIRRDRLALPDRRRDARLPAFDRSLGRTHRPRRDLRQGATPVPDRRNTRATVQSAGRARSGRRRPRASPVLVVPRIACPCRRSVTRCARPIPGSSPITAAGRLPTEMAVWPSPSTVSRHESTTGRWSSPRSPPAPIPRTRR